MRISFYILIAIVICLSITGCDWSEQTIVTGSGPVVSEYLDLDSFNIIINSGIANFYITTGSEQSVLLKAQQNIIDVMYFTVSHDRLKVGLDPYVSIRDHAEINFYINIPSINRIDLNGIGNFFLSGYDQDYLEINHSGVGNVDSYDMITDTCIVYSYGVGDCWVHVLNELNVTIQGPGNVYYMGDPAITKEIYGPGELIDDN